MFTHSRRSMIAATLSVMLLMSCVAFANHANSRANVVIAPVEFSLRSIDGQHVSNEDVRGQVVVLAFGASWLPLSRKQVQGVRKLADDYSKHGVIVYWVSTDSESAKSKNYASDEQLHAFARKYDLNLTILRDPDGKFSKQVGVDQLPSIVILDKQGNINGEPIGGLDPDGNLSDQLAHRLDQLL